MTQRNNQSAWLRFLVALLGLTGAFFAALYSSITREAGNLWATAALASVALLLAAVVGLTTVPYLARRVALEHVRDAVDYDVTREGVVYLVLVIVIGIAALNTGNNLLFVVLAAMLAAILVSGVASALVLRPLELDVSLPAHVFAETTVLARFTLRNRRRVLPSYSVTLVPPRHEARARRLRLERTTFTFPWWRPPDKRWFHVPDFAMRLSVDRPSSRPIFNGAIYYPYIAARSSVRAEVPLRFTERGGYRQQAFGLATHYPFSFLVKTRRIDLARELIVYPSVEPTDGSLEVLPMITGEFESFVRGRGNDLYRIREYQPEDSRKHVDWKATAKTGELKVREFTREDERRLRLVFDNPAPGVLSAAEYEKAVQLAASLSWHFAQEPGELSFAGGGYAGAPDVYEFLRYLALVQPDRAGSVLDQVEITGDYNLILTARARGSIPTELWTCSYVIFLNGTA